MAIVAKLATLIYKVAFSKESFAIFAAIKIAVASLCAYSANSVDAAFWGVLPWAGSLTVDIFWYATPCLLKLLMHSRMAVRVRSWTFLKLACGDLA